MRPKLFFIVKFLAPLKYYAKILPSLEKTYEVGFILLADRGTIKFCEENGYHFYKLFLEGESFSGVRIPFVSSVLKQWSFIKRCDVFLKQEKPTKLVAVVSKNFHIQALFDKANKSGIETIALQWAMQYARATNSELPRIDRFKRFVQKIYFFILDPVLTFFYKIQTKGVSDLRAYKAEKIGIMGEPEKENFLAQGYDPKKMRIVGNADFDFVHKLKRKIDTDITLRNSLVSKYGFDTQKVNILILSTIFYIGKTVKFTDEVGQVEYFKKIIEDVRKVYKEEEVVIFFKPHPKEKDIYSSFEKMGVKVCSKEAMTEELIALSDLVISHPETSANFFVLATNVPALFINFSPITSIDRGKEYYHIAHLIKNEEEFKKYILLFKEGKLEKQYDNSHFDSHAIEKIVKFIQEPL